MSSLDWKKAVRSKMTDEMFENSMGQLKAERQSLQKRSFDAVLPPGKSELSHEEKQAKKRQLIGRFKQGVDALEENRHTAADGQAGKYTDILASSFRAGDSFCLSPNPNPEFTNEVRDLEKAMALNITNDPKFSSFQKKSLKTANKDGKLWLLLGKLKNAQAEQSLKKEENVKKDRNANYVAALDLQMKERTFLRQMQDQDVQIEKMETDNDLAGYAVEKENQK